MGQLLPNAREARAWQAHAAHIDQASGGDCGFTCHALPNVRFGGDGCARTWVAAEARAQLADNIEDAMPTRGRTGGGMSLR